MELISRVKALLRRSMQNHEIKQMKVGEIELNDEKRQVKVSGEPITLTYKEYESIKNVNEQYRGSYCRERTLWCVFGAWITRENPAP